MLRTVAAALTLAALCLPAAAFDPVPEATPVAAYGAPPANPTMSNGLTQPTTYGQSELIAAGQNFFGVASAELAGTIQNLLSRFGEPNGYVLGEEASGAIFAGLRYGEGYLNTRTMGVHQVFWQGPSMGWDLGGSGSRVMMLVYDLPSVNALLQRFTGVDGSAYLVGGVSMTVMAADNTYLVPVRTGVGARLGFSLGYLKFTSTPTWNPF